LSFTILQVKTLAVVLQYESNVRTGPYAPARYPRIFLPPVETGAFQETRTDLESATTFTALGAVNLELEAAGAVGVALAAVPATTLYRGHVG
jgi:hypothetical protein